MKPCEECGTPCACACGDECDPPMCSDCMWGGKGGGETPLDVLARSIAPDSAPSVEWNEDNFTPVTPDDARDGLAAAMKDAREKGWIPKDDPRCECFTCRSFRGYMAADIRVAG